MLGVDLDTDCNETELIVPLFEGWIEQSGDPDVHLAIWLRNGAPTGIDNAIPLAGVFPESLQPPSGDLQQVPFGEKLKNYESMEESEFGE